MKTPKTIVIEEDYLEFHGQIYYAWRAEGAGAWNFKLTPHKQLPYVRWVRLSEPEYQDRLRRQGLAGAGRSSAQSKAQLSANTNLGPLTKLGRNLGIGHKSASSKGVKDEDL